MADVTRKVDIRYPSIIPEAEKVLFGVDDSGNLNAVSVDSTGAQKIAGDIGFVASVDIVLEPSVNYKSVAASITATSYPGTAQAVFGFTSRGVIIANDSSQDVTFSFNGSTNDTVIKANEVVEIKEVAQTQVFFKVASGSSAIRVLAW